MIGISETAISLLSFAPMILLVFSGYTVGRLAFKIVFKEDTKFMKSLIYGNLMIHFLFAAGVISFGLLTQFMNEFFTFFSYIILGLTALGVLLVFKDFIIFVRGSAVKLSWKPFSFDKQSSIFTLFGIIFFVTMLGYQCLIISLHPIYNEYDSIYIFLPVSKSILLGNGLNHDFYLGSDVNMKFAPFVQAINAWLMHSFEYSSIRLFPFYFVFFSSIILYYLAKNVLDKSTNRKDVSFYGIITSCSFLITPVILVMSSRFSLQQDMTFIFFLTASFFFLSEIVRSDKPRKYNLILLTISLALMSITREVGLVISIAIFFLVPAVKYTEGNLKLRLLFTIFSVIPFYIYYAIFYASIQINTGLIVTMVANLGIFLIVFRLKNQIRFSKFVRCTPNFICVAPLLVPLIFIVSNILTFNGLYPSVSFSDEYYETVSLQMDAFVQTRTSQFVELIAEVPRLDVLFISLATGGIFIIFKLIGFGKAIFGMNANSQYSIVLLLMILLVITWSSVLQSGYKVSSIRHIAYFVPLLSIFFVIGLKKNKRSSYYWKLFCCIVITFATVYFLSINIHIVQYNNTFSGFEIDPFKDPFMTPTDAALGIILGAPLLIFYLLKLRQSYRSDIETKVSKYTIIFTVPFLIGLIVIQVLALSSTEITHADFKNMYTRAPLGWEHHVFDVVNFLNGSEKGNVLSVRAPAIPFFTNRTNYDFFNQQAFTYEISDLALTKNSTYLKQRFSELQIKYIVIPNEKSDLYHSIRQLMNRSIFMETIDTDDDFEKIRFREFNVYKYNPDHSNVLDLIGKNKNWAPFGKTQVEQNLNNLTIRVDTSGKMREFNRAYLQTKLDLANKPLLLSIDYNLDTIIGNGTYLVEIRDVHDKIVFEGSLKNLSGNFTDETFLLPKDISGGQTYEFRVYLITQGPGHHILIVKKLSVSYA